MPISRPSVEHCGWQRPSPSRWRGSSWLSEHSRLVVAGDSPRAAPSRSRTSQRRCPGMATLLASSTRSSRRADSIGAFLVLRVRRTNERALGLYRSRGFVPSDSGADRGGEIAMERPPRSGAVPTRPLDLANVMLAVLVTLSLVVAWALTRASVARRDFNVRCVRRTPGGGSGRSQDLSNPEPASPPGRRVRCNRVRCRRCRHGVHRWRNSRRGSISLDPSDRPGCARLR